MIPSFSQGTFTPTKTDWGGNAGLPVIPSAMLLVHTCMETDATEDVALDATEDVAFVMILGLKVLPVS